MSSAITELPEPITDDRGSIQLLINHPIGSVTLIKSKKGSIRANHYHKEDDHYCYLISGCIEYYHRPTGSTEPLKIEIIKPGQQFYTPPMVDHTMKFLEDSMFFAFAKRKRDPNSYESDVVRVKLI